MVGTADINNSNGGAVYSNGSIHHNNAKQDKLGELRRLLGKADNDPLRIVGVGAGAWGSVFAALLQDSYGHFRDKVQIRVWRRSGRAVDKATAEHLFEVINSREDVLRRLIRRCAYFKYVEARLGDRTLYADKILRDGFCLNMIDTPLCPLKVVKSRGYVEDVRLSNVRLLMGSLIIVVALVAQFCPKKFPENRDFLIACIILYPFYLMIVLLSLTLSKIG